MAYKTIEEFAEDVLSTDYGRRRYVGQSYEDIVRTEIESVPHYAEDLSPSALEYLGLPQYIDTTKKYEPTKWDHGRNLIHSLKTIGLSPIGASGLVLGQISQAKDEPYITPQNVLKHTYIPFYSHMKAMQRYLANDEEFMDWAMQETKKGQLYVREKMKEWEEDPETKAYLNWQRDVPMTWKGFRTDFGDMLGRGVSSFLPSRIIGGAAAAIHPALGMATMFTMEGGMHFNETMDYLENELGLSTEEALPLASDGALLYGLVAMGSEYLGVTEFMKFSGISKSANRSIARTVTDFLYKNKYAGRVVPRLPGVITKPLYRTTELITEDFVQAFQEGFQQSADLMIQSYTIERGFDQIEPHTDEEKFNALWDDFTKYKQVSSIKEAITHPATKESFLSALIGSFGTGGVRTGYDIARDVGDVVGATKWRRDWDDPSRIIWETPDIEYEGDIPRSAWDVYEETEGEADAAEEQVQVYKTPVLTPVSQAYDTTVTTKLKMLINLQTPQDKKKPYDSDELVERSAMLGEDEVANKFGNIANFVDSFDESSYEEIVKAIKNLSPEELAAMEKYAGESSWQKDIAEFIRDGGYEEKADALENFIKQESQRETQFQDPSLPIEIDQGLPTDTGEPPIGIMGIPPEEGGPNVISVPKGLGKKTKVTKEDAKKKLEEYLSPQKRVQFPPAKSKKEAHAIVDGKRVELTEEQKDRLIKIRKGLASPVAFVKGEAQADHLEIGRELIDQHGSKEALVTDEVTVYSDDKKSTINVGKTTTNSINSIIAVRDGKSKEELEGDTLVIEGDQAGLIRAMQQMNVPGANNIPVSKAGKVDYGKADLFIQDFFKDHFKYIQYNNKQLKQKDTEFHELESGKFYSVNPKLAEVYAGQRLAREKKEERQKKKEIITPTTPVVKYTEINLKGKYGTNKGKVYKAIINKEGNIIKLPDEAPKALWGANIHTKKVTKNFAVTVGKKAPAEVREILKPKEKLDALIEGEIRDTQPKGFRKIGNIQVDNAIDVDLADIILNQTAVKEANIDFILLGSPVKEGDTQHIHGNLEKVGMEGDWKVGINLAENVIDVHLEQAGGDKSLADKKLHHLLGHEAGHGVFGKLSEEDKIAFREAQGDDIAPAEDMHNEWAKQLGKPSTVAEKGEESFADWWDWYHDPKLKSKIPVKVRDFISDLKKRLGQIEEAPTEEVLEKTEVKIIEGGTSLVKKAAREGKGIYVMRPNKGDKIPLVDEVNNFGNPWSVKGYQGTIKVKDIPTAVANYRAWIRGEAHQDIEPERRRWILDQINNGVLDNQYLLYFKSGYRSHADELRDFVLEAPAEVEYFKKFSSALGGYFEVVYVTKPLKGDKGRIVAARTNKETGQIFINKKELEKTYKEEAWTKPKVSGVEALDENDIQSFEEWEKFHIYHEQAHYADKVNKTLVNRENHANKVALANIKSDREAPAEEAEIAFEEDPSSGYRDRTRRNASADATIAIAINFESAGERLTKSEVLRQNKEYISIDAKSLKVTPERVDKIVDTLNSVNAKTLNIAGNGIYTMKGTYTQAEVDAFTYELLKAVVNHPNLKNKIESVRTGGQTGFDEAGAKASQRLGIPTKILAPKGWKFRDIDGKDISNEAAFKARFEQISKDEEVPVEAPAESILIQGRESIRPDKDGDVQLYVDVPTRRGNLNQYKIGAVSTDAEGNKKAQRISLPPQKSHTFAQMEGIINTLQQFKDYSGNVVLNTDLPRLAAAINTRGVKGLDFKGENMELFQAKISEILEIKQSIEDAGGTLKISPVYKKGKYKAKVDRLKNLSEAHQVATGKHDALLGAVEEAPAEEILFSPIDESAKDIPEGFSYSGDDAMLVKKSMISGIKHQMLLPNVTKEQVQKWLDGKLIQDVFPNLTKEQREFMITGIVPAEWEKEIRQEDDDEISEAEEKSKKDASKDIKEKLQRVGTGEKVKDRENLVDKIVARLKKKFPFVKVSALKKVFDKHGNEVMGKAIGSAIEYSTTKGITTTPPHEFAHIYLDIMRDDKWIKHGLKLFGDEHTLIDYMSNYYLNRIQDTKLRNRLKVWLRQFWLNIKKFFKPLNRKEIGDLISERFWRGKKKGAKAPVGEEKLMVYNIPSDSILYANLGEIFIDSWKRYKGMIRGVYKKREAEYQANLEAYKGRDLSRIQRNPIPNIDSTDDIAKWNAMNWAAENFMEAFVDAIGHSMDDEVIIRSRNAFFNWIEDSDSPGHPLKGIPEVYQFKSIHMEENIVWNDFGEEEIMNDAKEGLDHVFTWSTGNTGGEISLEALNSVDVLFHSFMGYIPEDKANLVAARTSTLPFDRWLQFIEKHTPKTEKQIRAKRSILQAATLYYIGMRNRIPTNRADRVEGVNVLTEKTFSPELLQNNPDKVYLFGDNTADRKSGFIPSPKVRYQSVVRGQPNAIGIDTKKNRGTSPTSYFTDVDFIEFKQHVDRQIQKAINTGKIIVLPEDGIGTGAANLKISAPKLFEYLQNKLTELKGKEKITSGGTKNRKTKIEMQYRYVPDGPPKLDLTRKKETSLIPYDPTGRSKTNPSSARSTIFEYKELKKLVPSTHSIYIAPLSDKNNWQESTGNDIIWLSKNDVHEIIYNEKGDRIRKIRYNTFTPMDLETFDGELSAMGYVIAFNRGDQTNIGMAKIKKEHIEIAKNPTALTEYWDAEVAKGNLTKEQAKRMSESTRGAKYLAGEIARYEAIERVLDGHMKFGVIEVFNRLKLAYMPSPVSDTLPSVPSRGLNMKNITFVREENGEVVNVQEAMVKVEGRGEKALYLMDGATLASAETFDNQEIHVGLDTDTGTTKTAIWDKDEEGSIFIKHQAFRPVPNVKIYENYGKKNEKLLVEIDANSNILDMEKNTNIGYILTEDEVKIATGIKKEKFDNGEIFNISGDSIGHISASKGYHNIATYPLQLHNYDLGDKIIEAFKEEYLPEMEKILKKVYTIVRGVGEGKKSQQKIADFIEELSLSDSFIDSVTLEHFRNGLGAHPFGAPILDRVLQTQIALPGLGMKNQAGMYGKIIHDYAYGLDVFDIAVDYHFADVVYKAYAEATPNVNLAEILKDQGKRKLLKKVNEWLEENDFMVLASRAPTIHTGSSVPVKIKLLHELKDQIFINPTLGYKYLESDSDGDGINIQKLHPKTEIAFGETYKDLVKEITAIDLSELGEPVVYDFSIKEDLYKAIEAITIGKKAIGEIANVQSILGLIHESGFKSVISPFDGDKIVARKHNEKITMPGMGKDGKDLTDTLANILRIYSQAATDNAKFLLLSKWGYNQKDLLNLLFKTEDGENITNDQLNIFRDMLDIMKHVGYIRNGRTAEKRLSFQDTNSFSELYLQFVNNRKDYIQAPNETIEWEEGKVGVLEEIAILPIKLWQKYELPGNQYSPVRNNKAITKNIHHRTMLDLAELYPYREEVERMENEKRMGRLNKSTEIKEFRTLGEAVVTGEAYARQMGKAYYDMLDSMGRNPDSTIMSWDHNPEMRIFAREWESKYNELNSLAKKIATFTFLNGVEKTKEGGRVLPVYEQISMVPSSKNSQKRNLLHHEVMNSFFNIYNQYLQDYHFRSKEGQKTGIDVKGRKPIGAGYSQESYRLFSSKKQDKIDQDRRDRCK